MKNLKKVLALALAVIMVMSMFTVAFAAETKTAADLTDYADINKKDAVNLCVDLGIINGKMDGSFAPTENIDRASWAKMVYFVSEGDDEGNAYVGSATALKDITGNWAEGYIAFLAANGIVSGDLNGNYNPANNVTVAEAAKMLLTTLGYDADDRGYQNNAAWSGNIMADAKKYGLMDNVDQKALETLNRENAAQMIYNALSANTVTYDYRMDNGVKYIIDYTKEATLGYETFGIVKVQGTISGVKDGKADFSDLKIVNANSYATPYSTTKVNGLISASASQNKNTVVFFVKATGVKFDSDGLVSDEGTFSKVISSVVAEADEDVYATITGGFNLKDAFTKSEDDYVGQPAANMEIVKYTANAAPSTSSKTFTVNNASALAGEITVLTETYKAGEVANFFTNDDGRIERIDVYSYSVGRLSSDPETKTIDDVLNVKLPGVTGLTSWKDASTISGYEDLVEGDVVLYYRDADSNYILTKAEVIESAKVTAVSSKKQLTINGTKYKATGLTTGVSLEVSDFSTWTNKDDEFNFYLDLNGTICYTKQITESIDKSKVAISLGAEWTAKSLSTSNGTLQAKLLFADGTTEIVDVAKVDGKKPVQTSSSTTTEITGTDAEKALNTTYAEKAFYNYKEKSNGTYELTRMVDGADWEDAVTLTTDGKIEAKSKFTATTGVTADSKTLFIVAKTVDDETTYYTYTGFKNVPAMEKANGIAIAEDGKSVARYVYLTTTSYSDDVPDGYVFLKDTNWEEDGNDNFLINVIDANGEETTLTVNEDVRDWVKGSATAQKFYEIKTVNDSGVVTSIDSTEKTTAKVNALGNDVININGTTYDYDEDTVVVVVELEWDTTNSKNDFVASTLVSDVDNYFHFDAADVADQDSEKPYKSIEAVAIGTANKTADFIYVVRVAW